MYANPITLPGNMHVESPIMDGRSAGKSGGSRRRSINVLHVKADGSKEVSVNEMPVINVQKRNADQIPVLNIGSAALPQSSQFSKPQEQLSSARGSMKLLSHRSMDSSEAFEFSSARSVANQESKKSNTQLQLPAYLRREYVSKDAGLLLKHSKSQQIQQPLVTNRSIASRGSSRGALPSSRHHLRSRAGSSVARSRLGTRVDPQSIIAQVMQQEILDQKSLDRLEKAFNAADSDKDGCLTIDEFMAAFKNVARALSPTQLTELFSSIDTDCNGTVEMDEFLSFFIQPVDVWDGELKLGPVHEPEAQRSFIGDSYQSAVQPVQAPDMIFKLCYLKQIEGFAGISRDGTAQIWHISNRRHIRSLRLWRPLEQPKWITDACEMPSGRHLVFASIDHRVRILDIIGRSSEDPAVGIFPKDRSRLPLCFSSCIIEGTHVLLWGDDQGHISVNRFSKEWHVCDGTLPCHKMGVCTGIESVEFKQHTDWVAQVRYISSLNLIASCSRDCTLKLMDTERGTIRWSLNYHKRGILAFEWSPKHNVFVTIGNAEREAVLWHAFTSSPVGYLKGHLAPISHAAFSDEDDMVITAAADKQIRAWDVKFARSYQTITDNDVWRPENRITAFLMDSERHQIVVASSKLMIRKIIKARPFQLHESGIAAICVNAERGHIITADTESYIQVWSWSTGVGCYAFRLSADLGPDLKIIALQMDVASKRLVIIVEKKVGVFVTLWNYVAGVLINEFQVPLAPGSDIGCISYVEQMDDYALVATTVMGEMMAWVHASNAVPSQYCLRKLEDSPFSIVDLVHLPNNRLAALLSNGNVNVYERLISKAAIACPKDESEIPDVNSAVSQVQMQAGVYIPDSYGLLACGSSDGQFHFFDVEKMNYDSEFDIGAEMEEESFPMASVAVDSTGSFVAAGDIEGFIWVIDVSQNRHAVKLRDGRAVWRDKWAPVPICKFKAQATAVEFISFVGIRRILSVGDGSRASIHTIEGEYIGQVGQGWQPELFDDGHIDEENLADSANEESSMSAGAHILRSLALLTSKRRAAIVGNDQNERVLTRAATMQTIGSVGAAEPEDPADSPDRQLLDALSNQRRRRSSSGSEPSGGLLPSFLNFSTAEDTLETMAPQTMNFRTGYLRQAKESGTRRPDASVMHHLSVPGLSSIQKPPKGTAKRVAKELFSSGAMGDGLKALQGFS